MRLTKELRLWKKGYTGVVGIDEVGRGPFAGPVVAVALMVYPESKKKIATAFRGLADSKKLSERKREYFFKLAFEHSGIEWGIGKSSEKKIDKMNILESTKRAMEKAVVALNKKKKIDYLLLDGNFSIVSTLQQESVIRGDEKIFSCALASVIAKVTRDKMMVKYHQHYPKYRFDRNKGYGTAFHRLVIKKHGLCPIHRKSFRIKT
ncbi:MAG: ribonuclease HII [Patescibacteria group bacterium]|nr:ribonuclease HII [Patescibacteria group bacterium]